MIEIPLQLQNHDFRFCKLLKRTKKPIEENWQNTVNYSFNDIRLIEWLESDNNYGAIGGFGRLVIIDIDDEVTANIMQQKLNTFTVKTGGEGRHFYIKCDYTMNHVFKDNLGELRANKYQVVGPNSIHPNGTAYTIINDEKIKELTKDELLNIIAPLIKDIEVTAKEQLNVDKEFLNKKVLSKLNNYTYSLITTLYTKDECKQTLNFSRSERDEKIIVSLLLNGFGNYIQSVFGLYPCGNKYLEHPSPNKYLERQIIMARKYTGVENDTVSSLEREIEELPDKVLKNKLDNYLRKLITIEDWLLRARIISLIASKIKFKTFKIEKRLAEIMYNAIREAPINLDNILDLDYKEPEYWVSPLLPKGAIVFFGGKPGSFKSMFATAITMYSQANKNFIDTLKVKNVPRILYYDLENGKILQQDRAHYIVNGMNLTLEDKEKMRKDGTFVYEWSFDTNNLSGEINKAQNFDIIVLDSYRRFLEGAEDKSEIVNKFYLDYLKKLKELGKTVIVIHHFKKYKFVDYSPEEIIDAFRGSSDIPAEPEIMVGIFKNDGCIELQQNMDVQQLTFTINVIVAKIRGRFPVKSFAFKVTQNDVKKSTDFEKTLFVNLTSIKDKRQQNIIDFVKIRGEVERSKIVDEMIKLHKVSSISIFKDLNELIKEKILKQPRYGFYSI